MKVFLSHQKKDRDEAAKVASYLKACGIDVYFDEFDRELREALDSDNPKGVVAAIKKGVQQSTHMFCIISPNTLTSKWVPFEVGYGYDLTEVMALTLKGIKKDDLPDYIRAVPIIRDIWDLDRYVKKHGNEKLMESRGMIKAAFSSSHSLSGVMDAIIT